MNDFADTCVFNKQSLGPTLCGPLRLPTQWVHLTRAPLLPKLRGHFAEFLLHKSLEHLRLLASPTCVRLRYGHSKHSLTRLFLAVCSTTLCGARRLLRHRRSAAPGGFACPETPTTLHRIFHHPTVTYAAASPLEVKRTMLRYGNINPLPIAYALRPRLRDRLTRSG